MFALPDRRLADVRSREAKEAVSSWNKRFSIRPIRLGKSGSGFHTVASVR
jgi:hypothetical protein